MCRNFVFDKEADELRPLARSDQTWFAFDTTLGSNQVIWIRLKARFRANNAKGQGSERSFQPLFQIPSNGHVGAELTFPAVRFGAADLPQ